MGADVPLQVEGVVEALPAVGAEVPLDVVVTLHVAVQHALVGEGLLTDVAGEEVATGAVPQRHLWARTVLVTDTQELGPQVGRLEDTHTSPSAPPEKRPQPSGHVSVPLAPGAPGRLGWGEPAERRPASSWAPKSAFEVATQPLLYQRRAANSP